MIKQTTISVRLTEDLLERFDSVTRIMRLGKADFIRGCVQKLCDDNAVLIDYHQNVDEYLRFVKNELAKLPQDLVIVKNGSWEDVKDPTMFLLCSEFWRTSKIVFDAWKKLIEKYDTLARAFSEFSKDLEEWWVHMVFRFEGARIENVPDLIDNPEEHSWLDYFAILNVTYTYATKKAIEETSAERIVRDFLETEEERLRIFLEVEEKRQGSIETKKKRIDTMRALAQSPLRLVINARGEPRIRADLEGKHHLSAVYTEKVES